MIGTAPIAKERGSVRVPTYRFAVIDDGTIIRSPRIFSCREALPDMRVRRELQGFGVILDRVVVVMQRGIRQTAIVPASRIYRVEPKRGGVVGDSVVVVELRMICGAARTK
jgi:hypothetical protein